MKGGARNALHERIVWNFNENGKCIAWNRKCNRENNSILIPEPGL